MSVIYLFRTFHLSVSFCSFEPVAHWISLSWWMLQHLINYMVAAMTARSTSTQHIYQGIFLKGIIAITSRRYTRCDNCTAWLQRYYSSIFEGRTHNHSLYFKLAAKIYQNGMHQAGRKDNSHLLNSQNSSENFMLVNIV